MYIIQDLSMLSFNLLSVNHECIVSMSFCNEQLIRQIVDITSLYRLQIMKNQLSTWVL